MLAKYNEKEKTIDWLPFLSKENINVSDELAKSLEKLDIEQLKTITSLDQLKDKYGITEESVFKYSQAVQNGSIQLKDGQTMLQGYQAYLQSTSKSLTLADLKTKALSASMKVLSTIGWMVLINIEIEVYKSILLFVCLLSTYHIKKGCDII